MSDILIVGAGSAGSVLAERLSADPGRRVTVLEAGPGPDDALMRRLTADATMLPIGPDSPVARSYPTTLTDRPPRPADIVRGRCVGGSGAVNGGYFRLPAPADMAALPGWSWPELDVHARALLDTIPVHPVREFCSVTEQFVAAARDCGYGWLPDLDTSDRIAGVGAVPLNIADGERVGPGAAFLVPALGRPNLTVLTETSATRVLIAGGRAAGVDAIGPGGPVRIDADEVVLSAGAIASAQLLMISGIGPADELAALAIPVIADLPVGRRCADHPEQVIDAGWPGDAGRPVLEAVLLVDGLEIRPYTRGFGGGLPQIGVAMLAPQARGRVSLISADPSAPPRIEHRYDSEPGDTAALAAGCERVADLLGGIIDLGAPQWSTSQHLCGTAPMGEVTDARCRVLGVGGLSVVDGSVLAGVPGRGPHGMIAALARRAAGFF